MKHPASKMMKKTKKFRVKVLFAALTAILSLSACSKSSDEDAGEKSAGGGNNKVSWTWGSANGMSGDAEYSYNDQGFVTNVKLYNGANGNLYRELVYNYDSEFSTLNDSGCMSSLTTLDGGGNKLYDYHYTWSQSEKEEDSWYISYGYGYDYILDEVCTNISYQELSHTVLSSTLNNMMGKSAYYWITEWKGDQRSVTHVFAKDGREDEDMLISWDYDGKKLAGVKIGQYEKYYEASTDDNGTITLTRDESHKGESKDLVQKYTYTLEYTSDGKPSCYSYHFYKEYENTDEPSDNTDSLTFTYEKDALAKVVCVQETSDYSDRTFIYNTDGNLISEDYMQAILGSGEIGACSYEYHDNGSLAVMNLCDDFTAEDSSRIQESWCYDETGRLSAKEERDGDVVKNRDYYSETGNVIKRESFGKGDNGASYLETSKSFDEEGNTTELIRYWENGNIYT